MTREQAKALLPVMQAFAEGKAIQIKCVQGWENVEGSISFDANPECYRIKPEPREFWIQQCRDSKETVLFAYRAKPKPSETNWELIHVREVLE